MDKKEQIIDVASALFAEQGFDKTPVSAIGVAANVSHGLIFHHFKNKNGLLRAIFERTTQQVYEMNKNIDDSLSAEEKIRNLVDQAFEGMVNEKDEFRLYMNLMFQPSTRLVLEDLIKERFEVLLQFTLRFFEGLPNQKVYSYLFISELDGIGMNYIYADKDYPIVEIKNEFLKRYLAYLT